MFNFKTAFFGLFVLLLLALPIGNYVVYSLYYVPVQKKSVEELEKYYPKIVADLKLIDQNPIFNKFTFEKNAEEVFEKNLSWTGLEPEQKHDLNHSNLHQFTEKYRAWKREPEVFAAMLNDPAIHTIDVSWMDNILNYDHWNVSNNPHIKEKLAKIKELDSTGKTAVFAYLPIPDYLELRSWTLVYFLKQHKSMNTLQGLKAYRKIAELTYSSSSTLATSISVKLLQDEAYMAQHFNVTDWKPVDVARINALQRLAWAWTNIVNNSFNQIIPLEVRDLFKVENGVCSAAWEVAPTVAIANDFFAPRFLLETDHSVDVARFQETVDKLQSMCKLETYKSFAERSPASVDQLVKELTSSFKDSKKSIATNSYPLIDVSRIPFVRRMYMYVMYSMGVPNTVLTRYYENASTSHDSAAHN